MCLYVFKREKERRERERDMYRERKYEKLVRKRFNRGRDMLVSRQIGSQSPFLGIPISEFLFFFLFFIKKKWQKIGSHTHTHT